MWWVHRRMLLMSSSLLFQSCPTCLVCLTWMTFEMGALWPYSCCFMEFCFQDLINIACSILAQFLSSFFSICQNPYSSIDITATWKKSCFILSDRSDFCMIDSLSIAVHNWRCSWCSRYHCRKGTWWHEFKSWTRPIAFHIALIPLGKVWIQLFSLQLWVNSRTD